MAGLVWSGLTTGRVLEHFGRRQTDNRQGSSSRSKDSNGSQRSCSGSLSHRQKVKQTDWVETWEKMLKWPDLPVWPCPSGTGTRGRYEDLMGPLCRGVANGKPIFIQNQTTARLAPPNPRTARLSGGSSHWSSSAHPSAVKCLPASPRESSHIRQSSLAHP